jgi:Holliday junction resolvasome RuvABC ATP-dependent DNA helicase subunit
MKFIGQTQIKRELEYLIPVMQEGKNLNILLRGPSGFGKTRLAVIIALNVSPDNCELVLATEEGVDFDLDKRLIIIDEVHLLKNPEVLYPYLDSGRYTFVLCSNEFGELKEPLVNRCTSLTFDLYSNAEIGEIITQDLLKEGVELSEECIQEIVKNSNGIPRTARKITETLLIIFKSTGIPDLEKLKDILKNVLQLENGLNPLHRRYLDYIQKVERASLDTLIFATRLDKSTICREIEPVLIDKNLIRITSRGRICLK